MKKIIALFVVTVILLTGCNLNNNPNSKVEELLGKYQSGSSDITINTSLLSQTNDLDEKTDNKYKEIIKKQYENLAYEIKDEKIDGDIATITTEIKVSDYKSILEKYNQENYTQEDYHKNILKDLESTKEKVTYTIDFTLTKNKKGTWTIDPLTTDIENKLLGIY